MLQEVYRVVWRDLSKKGRAVVLVVLLLAVAGLLAMAMWLGYDLSWVPPIIGGAVGGG